jgi:Predicted permeases
MAYWMQLVIACPMVFLAGFVDAIAGGGGLISLPAYYLVGIPPHYALGTNKVASCVGTAASTWEYLHGGHVEKTLIPLSIIGALAGSTLGAQCALFLDERVLRVVMVVLLPVLAGIAIFKKDLLQPKERMLSFARAQLIVGAMSLSIGWYDGFFGPGTGTFLMLGFVGLLQLDPITACGNTKVVNLCSNLAAAVSFTLGGAVLYRVALPCAFFSILGHMIGARLNVKNGAKLIKPVLIIVVLLLLATIVREWI